jgi:protein-tyrosine phosphatase
VRTGASARILLAHAAGPVDHATATAAMTEAYRDFVRLNADTFAMFLQAVTNAPGPVLFHCTAGKDRTGFAAALLLAALGAPREQIMADFLATARLWTPDPDLAAQILPAARPAVLGLQPAYLEAAFEELDRAHGGAAAFAETVLGPRALREWADRSLT